MDTPQYAYHLLPASLALALGGILAFILVPGPVAKAALCAVYGLGVGPVFPLLVGALAGRVGIARSYWFCAAAAGLLVGALAMREGAGREGVGSEAR